MTENVQFQTKERQRLTAVHYDKIKQQQRIKQTAGFRRKYRTKRQKKSLNIVDEVKQHGYATQNERERMTGPLSEMSVFIQNSSVSNLLCHIRNAQVFSVGSLRLLLYWICCIIIKWNSSHKNVHSSTFIVYAQANVYDFYFEGLNNTGTH